MASDEYKPMCELTLRPHPCFPFSILASTYQSISTARQLSYAAYYSYLFLPTDQHPVQSSDSGYDGEFIPVTRAKEVVVGSLQRDDSTLLAQPKPLPSVQAFTSTRFNGSYYLG